VLNDEEKRFSATVAGAPLPKRLGRDRMEPTAGCKNAGNSADAALADAVSDDCGWAGPGDDRNAELPASCRPEATTPAAPVLDSCLRGVPSSAALMVVAVARRINPLSPPEK
jgi:hypothetical protein